MISIKFEILFEVNFIHEYFKDGVLKEIDFRPTDMTIIRLLDYGLLFRKTSTGFVVLYEKDTHSPGEPSLKPIITDEKFSFEVYAGDPWFPNYTALPLDHKSPDIFYFYNLNENISSSLKLLNNGQHVNESNIVQLSSHIYNLRKTIATSSALIEIFDLNGIAVFSKTIAAIQLNGNFELDYQIDFSQYGSGRFNVKIDGTDHASLYVDSMLKKKDIFGIIDIYKSALVPATYAFADASGAVTAPSVKYHIRFGRRQSTWKYYVILKEFETDPGISIDYLPPVSGEEPYPVTVNFAVGTPEQGLIDTYGTGKVLLFESDSEIPLYEVPKKNIRLNKPEDPGDIEEAMDADDVEILRKHLPNAPITALKPNTDNSKVFSEIYVFI